MSRTTLAASLIAIGITAPAWGAPVMMSGEWAKTACDAWNKDPVLVGKLVESGWVANDKGRGYKILQIARADCGGTPTAELRVSLQDGKALCVYGGSPNADKVDTGSDYVMNAHTGRWLEMGRSEYGPMKAMMLGRLGFDGPTMEAMGNMGPFENFLKLVGSVPGDTATCPGK